MMEYTKCNLCGEDNTELVFEVEEQITSDHKKFHIVKCKNCGLVYVNPRPSPDDITAYYPPKTYDSYQVPTGRRKLRQSLKRLVWESLPGYSDKTGIFNKLLGRCAGAVLLPNIEIVVPFKQNGRILDIGCGNGQLTGWMSRYGWETYGVEIGRDACEQARETGMKVFCGTLDDAKYASEFFDAITISHVLEHVHSPLSLLEECSRILKRDGMLIVAVPNFGCFERHLFGESWFQIDAPRHLYHFTSETLKKMLNASGFCVDRWKSKLRLPFYHTSMIAKMPTHAS